MRHKRIAGLMAAGFAALILIHPVMAETPTGLGNRTLSVSGTGTVMAAPDIVRITAGVESRAQQAGQALSANTAAMQAAFAVLQQAGITLKDLQTSNFSISPDYYRDKNNSARPAVIIGYRVSNQLNVTVRNVAALGGILDTLVRQGINNIHNINFSVSNPQAKLDQARQKAIAEARRKAILYAQAAGARLGQVLNISEGSSSNRPSPRQFRSAAMLGAVAVPIAGGQQSLSVTVSVSWALE